MKKQDRTECLNLDREKYSASLGWLQWKMIRRISGSLLDNDFCYSSVISQVPALVRC